ALSTGGINAQSGHLAGSIAGGLAVTAWVIARTARAVGSKRGRWSVGWLVVMIMLVCGLVVTFIESARTAPPAADPDQPAYLNDGVPPQHNPAADLIVPLLLLALQLGIAFQVNRRAFRLSPGR